ncbi:GNAT family N-acetyltransferase [Streptomyces sp. ISL-100]|uniref:GNAT family N-acetyltransferase n=1 Tax=Streptomyces sp. ISL-100 TaxID=2819173 RepID=UPI001BE685AF|nr:GNAT family N-acetyltransferase [Streptomyces sp. ISL-100]MBT2395805.1 GNAT family N-acetyltransferase [Streptomyces sp. ISL-100]
MRLSFSPSLAAVPREEWDALAGSVGLYLSHRWLTAQESDPTAQPRYALVHDDAGRLVAATPLYVVHCEPNALYRVAELVPGAAPERRVVVAGARRGYLNAPLLHPSLAAGERRRCLELLLEAARTLGARHEAQPWWLYVKDSAAKELADVCGTDPVHLQQDAAIPLPGSSFDDYLGTLPSKRRVVIRRERRAFQEAGYEVRELRLSECADRAGELLAGLQDRHGHGSEPAAMAGLLRQQADGMGDSGTVLGCFLGGTMVGFSLFYRFGGTVWVRALGFDYPRLRGAQEYFSLAYYLPIEHAYRSGETELHLGMDSIRAKTLRGAEVSPLWAIANG